MTSARVAQMSRTPRVPRIAFVAFLLSFLIGLPSAWSQTFSPTGNMNIARQSHQATSLPNGDVLVTGGQGSSLIAIAQAEVFHPASGTWSITGSNIVARMEHTATLLQDGRVLVVGGAAGNAFCSSSASAETYDPVLGTWSMTGSLPETVGSGPTAVRLLDGRVLVSGGGNRCGAVFNQAALFDPLTSTWTATGSLTIPREFHSALLLSDGRVLVAGGVTSSPFNAVANAEIFDPLTGTWTPVGSMGTARGVSCNGYVLTYLAPLPAGMILAAGAFTGSCSSGVFPNASAEIFSPGTASWSSAGAMTAARALTTLTTLPAGTVLVAGGGGSGPVLSSAELFNPATGLWSLTGPLNAPRWLHTATLMVNGDVLIAGGADSSNIVATAEILSFHGAGRPAGTPGTPGTAWTARPPRTHRTPGTSRRNRTAGTGRAVGSAWRSGTCRTVGSTWRSGTCRTVRATGAWGTCRAARTAGARGTTRTDRAIGCRLRSGCGSELHRVNRPVVPVRLLRDERKLQRRRQRRAARADACAPCRRLGFVSDARGGGADRSSLQPRSAGDSEPGTVDVHQVRTEGRSRGIVSCERPPTRCSRRLTVAASTPREPARTRRQPSPDVLTGNARAGWSAARNFSIGRIQIRPRRSRRAPR